MKKLIRYLHTTQKDIQEEAEDGSLLVVSKIVTPGNNDDRCNEEI